MTESESNLEDFHEKITALFERYKEELNGQEHSDVNFLLYKVNNATDILLDQVKFEIDRFIINGIVEEAPDGASVNLSKKKAECLIKLQTLTSELSCGVMADYKKKVEEDRKKGFPM